MNEWSTEWQAFSRQQQLLAEARQARLVAQVRAPGAGQPSAQWSNLNAAVQQRPTGSAFDAAVRQLAQRLSRRRLWGVATAVALGAAIGRLPATDARNRNQKRSKAKKLQRNSFGCVDVGKACRGNSANCCSGICQGKKPKKGEKDTSRCVAHNVADCQAGQDNCAADGPTDCADGSGFCFQTTGKASFCAAAFSGACRACTKDIDCEAEFGAGAACAVCAESCGDSLNLCVSPLA
jgi:hypothetical protein